MLLCSCCWVFFFFFCFVWNGIGIVICSVARRIHVVIVIRNSFAWIFVACCCMHDVYSQSSVWKTSDAKGKWRSLHVDNVPSPWPHRPPPSIFYLSLGTHSTWKITTASWLCGCRHLKTSLQINILTKNIYQQRQLAAARQAAKKQNAFIIENVEWVKHEALLQFLHRETNMLISMVYVFIWALHVVLLCELNFSTSLVRKHKCCEARAASAAVWCELMQSAIDGTRRPHTPGTQSYYSYLLAALCFSAAARVISHSIQFNDDENGTFFT